MSTHVRSSIFITVGFPEPFASLSPAIASEIISIYGRVLVSFVVIEGFVLLAIIAFLQRYCKT